MPGKMARSVGGPSFGRPRWWQPSASRLKLAAGLETRKYSRRFEKHLGNAQAGNVGLARWDVVRCVSLQSGF
jgi:hypothetical protein